MKTIAQARKELHATELAWFEFYRSRVIERLAELLPDDVNVVLRIDGMQGDCGLSYHLRCEQITRSEVMVAAIQIEEELRPEFPEILFYADDLLMDQ